ncbi:hypothetical protein B484DRAFT_410710 [Ochromonadaceae sp. CCMP2298]|nr:hypothetical protein B484DRAFT_410710 [Ochromonadaceae sp. CCMP2298]
MDEAKAECRKLDAAGQPIKAFIFSDGFTIQKCNLPKEGKLRHSQASRKPLESRVVGVEVICGPIDEVFVYYTDNLVAGGANIMIEIQRQALIDLSKKLCIMGLNMPQELHFQFDNCGENKNKEMFVYMSALVETFKFSKIHINFLIVGHTHASIDQFFSTLSKAINGCNFIGTPQALMHLFMTKRSRSKLTEDFKIGLSKQIQVYYDYVKLFAPYTNTLIHIHAGFQ